jgi:hypothetical protein
MMVFAAKIEIIGINPYVAVPPEVSRALAMRRHIPVRGSINGFPIKATLVPVGGGRHRLYINGEMRKGAGVGVGDKIKVSIELDTDPRIQPVPETLRKALAANKEAESVWNRLPPSRRKEFLDYLNWLKTPAALDRNTGKVIAALLKKKNNTGI